MLIAFQIKIYRCSKYIGFELITENKTTFILPCPVKLSTLLKPTPMLELMQKATVEKSLMKYFPCLLQKGFGWGFFRPFNTFSMLDWVLCTAIAF